MADQFHLVERVVDGHRLGRVFLDPHDAAGLVLVGCIVGRVVGLAVHLTIG